jgi:hypothetical protein
LSEEEAVDIIANAVRLQAFQETAESQATLADSVLHALVSEKLLDYPNAVAAAKDGRVAISLKVPEDQQKIIHDRITKMLSDVAGIKELAIRFDPYF